MRSNYIPAKGDHLEMGVWDVNKLGWVLTPFSSHGGAWPRSRNGFSLTRVTRRRGNNSVGGATGGRGLTQSQEPQIHLWPPPVELTKARMHLSHSTLTACRVLTPRDLRTGTSFVSPAGNVHPKECQSQGAASPHTTP